MQDSSTLKSFGEQSTNSLGLKISLKNNSPGRVNMGDPTTKLLAKSVYNKDLNGEANVRNSALRIQEQSFRQSFSTNVIDKDIP